MLSFPKKSYNFFSKAKCCSKFILRRLKANMTKNPAGIKEKYNDRRHIPQTRTIPKIKREKIAENKDKKTILCHFISPSVIANSNFRGKIYSPTASIATGDAGFLRFGRAIIRKSPSEKVRRSKNGRRVFSCHPLGSDNTAGFEVSGALLSPVRPWVAVPNTTVFQTAPRQFPRDRVGLLTSKIGRIQPRVRIPRGRVFSRHPAG